MAEDQAEEEDMITLPVEVNDSDGTDDSASQYKYQPCHPYGMSKYFVFKRADEANKAVFACVMYQPQTVQGAHEQPVESQETCQEGALRDA